MVRNQGCVSCHARFCKSCISSHRCEAKHADHQQDERANCPVVALDVAEEPQSVPRARKLTPDLLKSLFADWDDQFLGDDHSSSNDVPATHDENHSYRHQEAAALPASSEDKVEQRISYRRGRLDTDGLNQILSDWDLGCKQKLLREKHHRASELLTQAVARNTEHSGAFEALIQRAKACVEHVQEELDGHAGMDDLDKVLDKLDRELNRAKVPK